jgi:hypothetical protein
MPSPQELGVVVGTQVRFKESDDDRMSHKLLEEAASMLKFNDLDSLRSQMELTGHVAQCIEVFEDLGITDYMFARVTGSGDIAQQIARYVLPDEDVLEKVVRRTPSQTETSGNS